MFKNSLRIVLSLVLFSACSEKKADFSTHQGWYFVKSLGGNVAARDFQGVAEVSFSHSNAAYRSGSLEAALLFKPVEYEINKYNEKAFELIGEPSITANGFVALNAKGRLTTANMNATGKFDAKLMADFGSSFCSNLTNTIQNNIVICSCGSNGVKAFDWQSGELLWHSRLDHAIGSKPLIVNGLVVVFAKSDAAYALKIKSGEVLWYLPSVTSMNTRSVSPSHPLMFDGYMIQQTFDDQVRAISLKSGMIEWGVNILDANKYVKGKEFLNHYGNFAFDAEKKTLYLNNSSGAVVKVKIGAPKADWIIPFMISKPLWLLGKTTIGLNDMGSLVAISKEDGKLLWSTNLTGKILEKKQTLSGAPQPYDIISFSAPIVVNGEILIVSSNQYMIRVNPQNGKIIKLQKFNRNIFGQPFVSEGKVYVMIDNGSTIVQL